MQTVTGVIGVSSTETARYSIFYSALTLVDKPPHTALAHTTGATISENRNKLAEQALTVGAEWIWYVDDDHIFPPDTLLRLLAHNVSVVSGLYLNRAAPYIPHMYNREEENGAVYPHCLTTDDVGLRPVLSTGAGCLLVRTEVLKQLEPPYWRIGQIRSDVAGDDIDFCRRVRAKGFSIWCDTDVRVGHFTSAIVYPTQQDGVWTTAMVDASGRLVAMFPAASEAA